MPKMIEEESRQIPGTSFQYSMIKPGTLGATEYTLVTIVIDITGSVYDFKNALLEMLKNIIKACAKHSRVENLLIRILSFNTSVYEIHGFREMSDIDPNSYAEFQPDGMTALYDAVMSAIGATLDYSIQLTSQDFNVNGAIYIITDGGDNSSTYTVRNIIDLLTKTRQAETLDSLTTILIGINTAQCGKVLEDFQKEAGLTQYVDVGDAHPAKLAKLGGWISNSISSTSQGLQNGAPIVQPNMAF